MSNKKRYSIRRFSASDVDGIVQLLNSVCQSERPFTKEWWTWKYFSNPAGFWGEQGDIWIAEDMGKIIGHYAVIPVKVKASTGTTVTSGQSVDTAVHPEYRRMGIFSELAKQVYHDGRDRFSFLYGYPSEMAYEGFLKLGWKDYPVYELVKFVNYERSLKPFLSSSLSIWAAKVFLKTWQATKRVSSVRNAIGKAHGEDVTMHKIDKFGDEIDAFWKAKREDSGVMIERTQSYLNWRFSKNFGDYQKWIGRSNNDGRVLGYSVFRRTQLRHINNVLEIADICALPKEDKLVLAVVDLCLKEKDIDVVYLRVPTWHSHAKIFSRMGFLPIRRIMNRAGLYEPKLFVYDFDGTHEAPRIQDWHYSLADTDYA